MYHQYREDLTLVEGVLVANNTKFVNSTLIHCVVGRADSTIMIISGLACTKGLVSLTPITRDRRFTFRGISVYSQTRLTHMFARRRPSYIVRLTTRDRISHSVSNPTTFVRAGVIKACALLRTTQTC